MKKIYLFLFLIASTTFAEVTDTPDFLRVKVTNKDAINFFYDNFDVKPVVDRSTGVFRLTKRFLNNSKSVLFECAEVGNLGKECIAQVPKKEFSDVQTEVTDDHVSVWLLNNDENINLWNAFHVTPVRHGDVLLKYFVTDDESRIAFSCMVNEKNPETFACSLTLFKTEMNIPKNK